MLNEITNELSVYRAEKLLNHTTNDQINKYVHAAMERCSPGSLNGLMGVDAHSDGLTRHAWDQAVYAAESVAAIVFGYSAVTNMTLSDVEPVTFESAMEYVADRVAESILTLHGYERVGRQKDKVYVVITENRYGYICDLEVMDAAPTLDPQDEVDGTTILAFEANINGGDSLKYEWK
jgi:hypothetical protein